MKYFIFLALVAATYAAPVQDDKIVRGYECRKNSVPYQVYLKIGYTFCGAALISRTWAVTVPSCSFSSMKLYLGEHDIAVDEGTEQIIDVEKTIEHNDHPRVHWDFQFNTSIMLVKLSKPATLNNYVRTVSLPTSCPVAGTKCLISGWGENYNYEGYYDRLMCRDVPIMSDTSCESSHPDGISPNKFCAESIMDNYGYCLSEHGTPLVCNGQLQGLLSRSCEFTVENKSSLYTEVCKYNSWIRDTMMSE